MCASSADLNLAFVRAETFAPIGYFRCALSCRPLALRNLANLLMVGLGFVRFTQPRWNSWSAGIASALARLLMRERGGPLIKCEGGIHTLLPEVPLSQNIGVAPPDRSVTFRRLKITEVFEVVAMSAEVSYVLRAPTVAGGCADHCFGYCPTDSPWGEGEYEGDRYFSAFGMNGLLKPDLAKIFANAVAQLSIPSRVRTPLDLNVRHRSEQT
jgi:hypothetical protein